MGNHQVQAVLMTTLYSKKSEAAGFIWRSGVHQRSTAVGICRQWSAAVGSGRHWFSVVGSLNDEVTGREGKEVAKCTAGICL